MVFSNSTLDLLMFREITNGNKTSFLEGSKTDMILIWNKGYHMSIVINQVEYLLMKNDIMILNRHHSIGTIDFESLRLIKFNLPFFNHTNDELENDLKRILFFNLTSVPLLSINEDELQYFESSWDIFCLEMKSNDSLKYAMLQSVLKRLLILCTRKFKKNSLTTSPKKADILKEFRFLVENYYSKHHDLAFYASMLNRSSKTLSNVFSLLSDQSPIDIIHERIMADARKQIYHTNKSIKEIAYSLGYEDIQTFSRFFKNKEGISPIKYREKNIQWLGDTVI
jgi:AraC-like DNA-binding protein